MVRYTQIANQYGVVTACCWPSQSRTSMGFRPIVLCYTIRDFLSRILADILDLLGKWDQTNPYTGPYVLGHTNITEIEMGLDLLRRNDIDFAKVNLGVGFYGRSFTLSDRSCSKPGCIFSDAGVKGECSGEAGILTFAEITARQNRLNVSRSDRVV